MSLPVNTLLRGGTYRIKKFLSSGGFGCTYEAEHVMLGKRFAIKEFFVKDFCNRDEETSRVCVGTDSKKPLAEKLKKKFIDEARSVCKLKHPNIVSVSDVFEENGTAYFVMDYIDGDTLSGIIKREGSLPEKRALKYILQVCDALEYVHKNKRLHLDLKPGNIMIDRNGDRAVLIDFGASKQYDEESGENTSTLAGKTPGYAPLEQMGNDVTKFHEATDIYALGATFYKLLTGITPPGSNMLAAGEEIAPLPEIVSPNVKKAISEAMRLRRVERPQSIAEFRDILTGAGETDEEEDERTVIDNPEPTTKPTPKPTPKPMPKPTPKPETKPQPAPKSEPQPQPSKASKGNKWIFIVAGVVAAAIIAGVLLWPSKKEAPKTLKMEELVTDMELTNEGNIKFLYTGQLEEGKMPNGKGMGKYEAGTYNGNYLNGVREGYGKFVTKDGSNTFLGSFKNDLYDKGKLIFKNKDYFEGTFKDNKPYEGKYYDNKGNYAADYKAGNIKWKD